MTCTITSANLNGIRSAQRRGFFEWMTDQRPDVLCVQETKAQMERLDRDSFIPKDYNAVFADAQKPGYSGVGLYSRRIPDQVIDHVDFELSDLEGRYIQADFGEVSVISVYMPSGSSGEHRQAEKYRYMEWFEQAVLLPLATSGRKVIICGDWNIVHTEADIKNWKSNQKNSGCLPEERAWLNRVFGELGWVDAFRVLDQAPEQYTWWSFRGQARAKNVGWRIDYQVITKNLQSCVLETRIDPEPKFSDHAPFTVTYDLNL